MFEKDKIEPEKIIGMKPEELKARLDSSVTKDDLTAATKDIGEMKSGLEAIKEALAKLTAPKETPVIEPGDPTTEVLTDPAGFINKHTKPIVDANTETRAQVQEMRARQNPKFSNIFVQFGDELVANASKFPASNRAQDGFWEWNIRTFLGDKYIKGDLQNADYPSLIGTSTVAPNPDGSSNDPNKGFKPEMAQWLKDRNVPLDKAAKIQSLMSNGEQLTLTAVKGGNA